MHTNLLSGALFISLLLGAGGAGAERIDVAGQPIDFDPGAGYCALDAGAAEFDRFMIDLQINSNAGENDLLGMYVLCAEIDGLRSGAVPVMGQYGILLAPLDGGVPASFPGMSRAAFLDEVAAAIGEGIDLDTDDIADQINRAIDPSASGKTDSIDISDFQHLGLLHRDDAAAYSGFLMRVESGQASDLVAGVSAMALVRERVLQYSLYRLFDGPGTFDGLIADLQPVMADLIARNLSPGEIGVLGPVLGSDGKAGLNWARIGELAISSALIGGLIGLLLLGVGRLRRGRRGAD